MNVELDHDSPDRGLSRPLRIEFPGAPYHLTRGTTQAVPTALAAALAWLAAGASATQNVVVTDIKYDVADDLARRIGPLDGFRRGDGCGSPSSNKCSLE